MDEFNRKRKEHFYTVEYIKNETKDLVDFFKENGNRKIKKKYAFRLKVIAILLTVSNAFGIVLANAEAKKLDNSKDLVNTVIASDNDVTEVINEDEIIEVIDIPDIIDTPLINIKMPGEIEEFKSSYTRDNITINNLENDEIIRTYAGIFEFDYELVRNIITPLLENDQTKVNNDNRRRILEILIDIYYNTENYGYTRNDLRSNIEFETELVPEEQLVIFSDIFDVNPYDALGIMTCEWGHPYSRNENMNNIFGWYGTENTPNKTVSMIISIAGLSNNYGLTRENNRDRLINMASTYCPPNTDFWISVVLESSGYARNYGIFYDYDDSSNFIFNNETEEDYINNGNSISRRSNARTL